MRMLITGVCGFVGSTLALYWREHHPDWQLIGIDNLIRPGSDRNRAALVQAGVTVLHGDIRVASDFETLPAVDWVVDAAANPSVLAGVDGNTSSRQVMEHNLQGTLQLLEYCKLHTAGFILLSTSRVYSIPGLAGLPVTAIERAFRLEADHPTPLPSGITAKGVNETYSTAAPVSLYGASKVASEALAIEYGLTFGFPVWINRCGVLAGAGQFGHAQQGIFSYWLHAWKQRQPLKYIGFGGSGYQVRDCLHPLDLAPVLAQQLNTTRPEADCIANFSGGVANSCSLTQLSDWCTARWGAHEVASEHADRPFDIPWMVLDASKAEQRWGFKVQRPLHTVLEEIAEFAEQQPDWLKISKGLQ